MYFNIHIIFSFLYCTLNTLHEEIQKLSLQVNIGHSDRTTLFFLFIFSVS